MVTNNTMAVTISEINRIRLNLDLSNDPKAQSYEYSRRKVCSKLEKSYECPISMKTFLSNKMANL